MVISAVWISFIVLTQQLHPAKSDDFSVPNISDSYIPTVTPFDNENEFKNKLSSENESALNLKTDSDNLTCINSHNCSISATTPQTLSTLSKITWNPVPVKVSPEATDSFISAETPTDSSQFSDASLGEIHSTLPTPLKTIPTPNEIVDHHDGNELDSEVKQSENNSISSTILTEPTVSTTQQSTTEYKEQSSDLTTSNSVQMESNAVTNLETTTQPNISPISTIPTLSIAITSAHSNTHDKEHFKSSPIVNEDLNSYPSTITDSSPHSEQDAESLLPNDLNLIQTLSTLSSKKLIIENFSTSSAEELNKASTELQPFEVTTLSSKELNNDEIITSLSKEPNNDEVITSSPKETNTEEVTTSIKDLSTSEVPASPKNLNTDGVKFATEVSVNAESREFESTSTERLLTKVKNSEIVSSTETLGRTASKNVRFDERSETPQSLSHEQDVSPSSVISQTAASDTLRKTTASTVLDLSTAVPFLTTEYAIDADVSTKGSTINIMSENNTTESTLSSGFTKMSDIQSTNIDIELTSEMNFDNLGTSDSETFMNNHVFEITEQISEETSETISNADYSDLSSSNSDSEIATENTEEVENAMSSTDKEYNLSSETSRISSISTPIPFLFRTPHVNDTIATTDSVQGGGTISDADTSTVSSFPETTETSTIFVNEISSSDSPQTARSLPSDYFHPIENVSNSISRNITHLFVAGESSTTSSGEPSTTTLEQDGMSNHIPLMVSTEEESSLNTIETTFSETSDTYSTLVSEIDSTSTEGFSDESGSSHFTTTLTDTSSSNLFTMATHREGKHIPFSTTNSKDKSDENPSGGVIVVTTSTSHEIQVTEKSLKMIPVLQREYEDLTTEQKTNIITSVVQLPSNYNSDDIVNEKVAQIHQWMQNVLEIDFRNRTKNYLSDELKSKVDAADKHSLELIYIHPTPEVHLSNISFTFYAFDNTLNETLPAYFLLSSLRTKSEELLSLVNANATYFYHGLLPEKYDFLTVIIEKYGTIVAATCLAALVLIILLVCVVIYYRRKTRYSAHNLTNTKLHRNMQEAMGLDLNPAVVILQDELKEKVMNGNKVCSLDDNEGWLVPFTDVPLGEDKDAPRVQDTKL
ncbi:uncharacterized protein [Parasteatoda tepidariorum]|uniref:uncharacterized protein isoform X1 n=2 Tax=Parasteatoda tepidariorum TaxID=114398 RepID=UPI001C724EA2|nr:serine-rich adhesin for platelets isoform X1 [Parasteatoda tepidariorum]